MPKYSFKQLNFSIKGGPDTYNILQLLILIAHHILHQLTKVYPNQHITLHCIDHDTVHMSK